MRVLIYILALLFFITSACKKKLKTKVDCILEINDKDLE